MQKISKLKTATSYALAWLEAAKDKKSEELVFEEAKLLKTAYHEDMALWRMLAAPINDNGDVMKTLEAMAKKIKLSAISTELLKLMAANGRLGLAGMAFDEFIRLYYQDKGIVDVQVDTAVALDDRQDKKLKKVLEDKLNAPVTITYEVKPEVLGGLAVRYGSFLIDDTLEGKLNKVEALLKGEKVG